MQNEMFFENVNNEAPLNICFKIEVLIIFNSWSASIIIFAFFYCYHFYSILEEYNNYLEGNENSRFISVHLTFQHWKVLHLKKCIWVYIKYDCVIVSDIKYFKRICVNLIHIYNILKHYIFVISKKVFLRAMNNHSSISILQKRERENA